MQLGSELHPAGLKESSQSMTFPPWLKPKPDYFSPASLFKIKFKEIIPQTVKFVKAQKIQDRKIKNVFVNLKVIW